MTKPVVVTLGAVIGGGVGAVAATALGAVAAAADSKPLAVAAFGALVVLPLVGTYLGVKYTL